MSEHADRADELDAEVEDMQHQSDRLKAEIDETRDDWQTKKRDDSVPGAGTGEEAEPEPEPTCRPGQRRRRARRRERAGGGGGELARQGRGVDEEPSG